MEASSLSLQVRLELVVQLHRWVPDLQPVVLGGSRHRLEVHLRMAGKVAVACRLVMVVVLPLEASRIPEEEEEARQAVPRMMVWDILAVAG